MSAETPKQRLVYRAFRDPEPYIDDMYKLYRLLYDLPEYTHSAELKEYSLFEYCLARRYFLLILPYSFRKEVLLAPVFSGNDLSWRIIGGGVKDSFDENFVSACQAQVSKFVKGVVLGEIEPVAFINNVFSYQGQTHTHKGIVFIARIRNAGTRPVLEALPKSSGHFVDLNRGTPTLHQPHQPEILRIAAQKIDRAIALVEQDDEIDANEAYKGRYAIHDAFIKPAMRAAGRLGVYPHSIADLDKRIRDIALMDDCGSIMDVACGENFSIVNFAAKDGVPLVVGNDISWSQIELMAPHVNRVTVRNTTSFVLFTNHDGRRLPFRDRAFDCVICKNVLHHMPDRPSVTNLINEIRRVGKRSLIVEVMDPKFEGRWGRLRHRYYLDFLKDAGGNFLSRQEFEAVTHHPDRVEHFEMRTLRGVYMFARFSHEARETASESGS